MMGWSVFRKARPIQVILLDAIKLTDEVKSLDVVAEELPYRTIDDGERRGHLETGVGVPRPRRF
jgi:hypothetical protein